MILTAPDLLTSCESSPELVPRPISPDLDTKLNADVFGVKMNFAVGFL